MDWLGRRSGYDRARILDAAARARARKKPSRAVALYRRVLAREPQNAELHAKLAPLLAEIGQEFDAWCSFKTVARACLREGHADRALTVYRDATLYLPREVQAWQAVARIQLRRGRPREAVETLLQGSRHFRGRWLRPQAIFLLRRAREIEPWDFELVFELARLLTATAQRPEARLLLEGLAARSRGERLRRVRGAQVGLDPGVSSLWRWLQSIWRPERAEPATRPQMDPAARGPTPQSRGVVSLRAIRGG